MSPGESSTVGRLPSFDPEEAKKSMVTAAKRTKLSTRFADDIDDHAARKVDADEILEEDKILEEDEEGMRGLVKMPPQTEHTYFVLLRPPKGGLEGANALQKVSAKLSSRFGPGEDVVLKGMRAEPYMVENGKNGRHYVVLTAKVSEKISKRIAEKILSWSEVVGLYRKLFIETILFTAFADVYDTTGKSCMPVPPRNSRKAIRLDHEPAPAISLDALMTMVATLDLNLQKAQVCTTFDLISDASAQPRVNWTSVALTKRHQAARQLEGNRSREVAKKIAGDWKDKEAEARTKFEKLAKQDHDRYCKEKHQEMLRHLKSKGRHR